MVFSEFKSVMTPNLATEKLLPIEKIAKRRRRDAKEETDSAQIRLHLRAAGRADSRPLLPRYIETQVLRAMLESSAAEHAARMTAMEAATKNAGDVIEALDAAHEQSPAGGHHQRNY